MAETLTEAPAATSTGATPGAKPKNLAQLRKAVEGAQGRRDKALERINAATTAFNEADTALLVAHRELIAGLEWQIQGAGKPMNGGGKGKARGKAPDPRMPTGNEGGEEAE